MDHQATCSLLDRRTHAGRRPSLLSVFPAVHFVRRKRPRPRPSAVCLVTATIPRVRIPTSALSSSARSPTFLPTKLSMGSPSAPRPWRFVFPGGQTALAGILVPRPSADQSPHPLVRSDGPFVATFWQSVLRTPMGWLRRNPVATSPWHLLVGLGDLEQGTTRGGLFGSVAVSCSRHCCFCQSRLSAYLLTRRSRGNEAMNIVQLILKLLGGNVLNQLAESLGLERQKAETGIKAAIPGLLAGVTGMLCLSDGADKLSRAVDDADDGLLGDLTKAFGGGSSFADKGLGHPGFLAWLRYGL